MAENEIKTSGAHAPESSHSTEILHGIGASAFADLFEEIREEHREMRRLAKRRVVLLGILLPLMLAYTGWIYSQVRQIDEAAVAQAMRGYVLANLPELRESLRTALTESAAQTTDLGKQALLQMPTLLRHRVDDSLPAGSKELASRFEDELNLHLEIAVDGIADLLRDHNGKQAHNGNLQKLARDARETYRGMILTIVDETHDDYVAEIDKLNTRLQRLETGRSLSQREKVQREIIEASLILMDRYGITGPQAPESVPPL
jgi:hypothetical protein